MKEADLSDTFEWKVLDIDPRTPPRPAREKTLRDRAREAGTRYYQECHSSQVISWAQRAKPYSVPKKIQAEYPDLRFRCLTNSSGRRDCIVYRR